PEPRRRNSRRDCYRIIQVLGLDHVVAAQLLLGLRKRTIRDELLAISHPYRGRLRYRMQLVPANIVPALGDRLREISVFLVDLALFRFAEFAPLALLVINQQQILHFDRASLPSPVSRTRSPLSTIRPENLSGPVVP